MDVAQYIYSGRSDSMERKNNQLVDCGNNVSKINIILVARVDHHPLGEPIQLVTLLHVCG